MMEIILCQSKIITVVPRDLFHVSDLESSLVFLYASCTKEERMAAGCVLGVYNQVTRAWGKSPLFIGPKESRKLLPVFPLPRTQWLPQSLSLPSSNGRLWLSHNMVERTIGW